MEKCYSQTRLTRSEAFNLMYKVCHDPKFNQLVSISRESEGKSSPHKMRMAQKAVSAYRNLYAHACWSTVGKKPRYLMIPLGDYLTLVSVISPGQYDEILGEMPRSYVI